MSVSWPGTPPRPGTGWPERLADDCFALDLNRFFSLEPALQRRVLRAGVARLGAEVTLTAPQVASLLALAGSERSGGLISLGEKGENVQVARAGAVLHIMKALPDPPREATLLPDCPAEVESPAGWRWHLARRACRPGDPWPPPEVAWLDPARVSLPLTARSWRPGDRFWPQGAPGPKKLQDFLVDAKIPRWLRPHLPLVAARRGDCLGGGRQAGRPGETPAGQPGCTGNHGGPHQPRHRPHLGNPAPGAGGLRSSRFLRRRAGG